MSDHQPAADGSDLDTIAAGAPAEGDQSPGAATDPHEPDFSRLRMARATLDAAFPEE